MSEPRWSITVPITKAESRNGRYYLTGIASGTSVDGDGERMAPEAVESFALQVNAAAASGEPIPFRNAHADDGVYMDLGVLSKAWITPEFEMGVEVELDPFEMNSAAKDLWSGITVKKKKWGMSVAGLVHRYADEWSEQFRRTIRTFYEVLLSEVSATTRPSYTPSLGTVLAKAIKDAAQAESSAMKGENPSMDEELRSEQGTDEPAVVDKSDEGAVESPAEEPVEKTEDTPEAGDDQPAVTEKARSAKTQLVTALSAFLSAIQALELEDADGGAAAPVPDIPISADPAEKSTSGGDSETTVDKSLEAVEALKSQVAELAAANEELRKSIAALGSQPALPEPGLVYDEDVVHDFRKSDPHSRLVGLLRVERGG